MEEWRNGRMRDSLVYIFSFFTPTPLDMKFYYDNQALPHGLSQVAVNKVKGEGMRSTGTSRGRFRFCIHMYINAY